MKQYKINDFLSKIVQIYAALMVSIFLFYFHDGYFDITASKYQCFLFLTYGTLCILFISCLCLKQKICFSIFYPKSICDWSIYILCACHVITTICSPYPYESIWGTYGRGCGLIFTFTIGCMYLMVTRFLPSISSILSVFLYSCFIVIGLGMCNFCGWDVFGIFKELDVTIAYRYLSTTGNVTFFAHLMCFFLPISCVLYQTSHTYQQRYFYALCVCSGFIGLYIANIDSAYLGISAFLLFHWYQNCLDHQRLQRFLEVLMFGNGCAVVLGLCSKIIPMRTYIGFSSIIYSFIPVICLCLHLFLYLYHRHHIYEKRVYLRIRKHIVYFISLCLICLLILFLYVSFVNTDMNLGNLSGYLHFDDAWGSRRGFAWKSLSYLYWHDFSLFHKLFGYGLDSVRILMGQMVAVQDSIYFDNAHNEYLQYLMTSGLFGLISYLIFYVSAMVRLFRNKSDTATILLSILIAHGVQACCSINQPITTPLLFLFIALGEGLLTTHYYEIH